MTPYNIPDTRYTRPLTKYFTIVCWTYSGEIERKLLKKQKLYIPYNIKCQVLIFENI